MRTLTETAAGITAGTVTPADLVDEALDAIDRLQPQLNAFTHVFADTARARAKELETVRASGPLHGIPVAVKELYDLAGAPTTGCCAAYADRVAESDSAVVERLRGVGAIIVAKTNQHELAEGGTTQNSSFGPAWNPWGENRMTGGSSGGSAAAVAARIVPVAIGSDSLGSIRIPSSWCGTTGLKTTHGTISMRGAMPFLPSCDSAGPIARTAAECRVVYDVLVGYDPADPWSRRGEPPKATDRPSVALMRRWMTLCTPDVRARIEEAAGALESDGVIVEELEGPDPDVWAWLLPVWAEFADSYRDLWERTDVSEETTFLLNLGRGFSAVDAAQSASMRLAFRREFENVFAGVDAVLAPATPFPAPVAGQEMVDVEGGQLDVRAGCARFTSPVNAAGLPALAFPVGMSEDGMPVGAQLIGPPWSERTLFAIGERYQAITGWHDHAPPVVA